MLQCEELFFMSFAENTSLNIHEFEKDLKSIVKKYALEAVWLKDNQQYKHHLTMLNSEIASKCGKQPTSISISDISRILGEIESRFQKMGLGNITFDKVEKIYLRYVQLSPYIDVSSLIYSVAMATKGNPGPLLRKLFIKTSNKVNAQYVLSTYVIGQLSISLYAKDLNLDEVTNIEKDPIDDFDPIFKLLNEEHVKDLSKLLKLSIDINTPIDEARLKIINELNYRGSNKIKFLYNKALGGNTNTYKSLLLLVGNDLKVEITDSSNVDEIEEKIVMRVLHDTVQKLSDKARAELEEKLKKIDSSVINKEAITSGGALAAILGLKASGFGVYIAASSALGALTNGLGISLAFSTYTTMSTLIAGILGPIGIGTAVIGLLASLSIAEPKKTLPAVVYIAMIRRQLAIENLSQIDKKRKWPIIFGIVATITGIIVTLKLSGLI